MPRYPHVESVFFFKLISWDERYRDRASIGDLLERYTAVSGRRFLGYRGARALLSDIEYADIPALFRPDVSKNSHNFLFGDPLVSISVTWEDPDWVETVSSLNRMTVMGRMATGSLLTAETEFLHWIDGTSAFWGELNVTAITGSLTFSGLNQHLLCMPKFGTVNFLGPDYVRFLGEDNLATAGFASIEPHGDGLVTRIAADCQHEFSAVQNSICEKLGGDRIFKKWGSDDKPKFEGMYQHVLRHRASVPPMEFRVTARGLKKRPIKPEKANPVARPG